MSAEPITSPGVVLGTARYMSPEQVKGEDVDTRTDVWAFGCVLYEMLTARPAFAGRSVSEVVAAVLRDDPDWHALPASGAAQCRAGCFAAVCVAIRAAACSTSATHASSCSSRRRAATTDALSARRVGHEAARAMADRRSQSIAALGALAVLALAADRSRPSRPAV